MAIQSRRLILRGALGASTLILLGATVARANCPSRWPLLAGRTTRVGTLTVSDDPTTLFLTYELDRSVACSLGKLHAWAGTDLALLPVSKQGADGGAPVPGQFPYKYDVTGAAETAIRLAIPMASLALPARCPTPTQLFIVAHAEVAMPARGSCGASEGFETAFAGSRTGSGRRWWFYDQYRLCCSSGPDPT